MPKYLKGLNQAVSMAGSLFPHRARKPPPQASSGDPESEDTLILDPTPWAEGQQESSPVGS